MVLVGTNSHCEPVTPATTAGTAGRTGRCLGVL